MVELLHFNIDLFSIQYANGGNLHDAIKKQQALNESWAAPDVCEWITQAFSAIAYLHSFETHKENGKYQKGLLHRDLKPGNIFLHFLPGCKVAILKIGDLGLARTLDDTNAMASTKGVGTPLYMAPEAHENVYGLPFDVWALGLILFELRYGEN